MKNSATDAAARENLARDTRTIVSDLQSARDRLMPVLAEQYGDAFDGDFDSMLEAINTLKRFATATLTQQQGGEQEAAWQNIETAEVEFLNNLAEKGGLADPVPGMLRHCARLIAGKRPAVIAPDRYETEEEGDAYAHGYVDGEDAALRTKQPAASEGDERREYDAFAGAINVLLPHGIATSKAVEIARDLSDNTSKQAAGEAVRSPDGHAYLYPDGYIRHNGGGAVFGFTPIEKIPYYYNTPPRHPADERGARDAARWRAIRHLGKNMKLYVYDDQEDPCSGDWVYDPNPELVDAVADAALQAGTP